MSEPEDHPVGPPPGEAKGDVGSAIARAAVAAVPVFGGPAAELLDLVLKPALGRRREEWLTELAARLDDHIGHAGDLSLETLAENEMFITAVLAATNAALRTHEAEKRTALRNAVISSATSDLDEYEQLTFIRYVDELTAFHLRLMVYLRDPSGWFDEHDLTKPNIMMGGRSAILEAAMPELADQRERYNQAVGDLVTRHLAIGGLSGMVSENSLYDSLTTAFGNRFLDYLSAEE